MAAVVLVENNTRKVSILRLVCALDVGLSSLLVRGTLETELVFMLTHTPLREGRSWLIAIAIVVFFPALACDDLRRTWEDRHI